MLRKLLALGALMCWCSIAPLVAAESPSKVKAKPSPVKIKSGKLDKGDPEIAPNLSCQNLLVYLDSSSTITTPNVSCDHGYYISTLPSSGKNLTVTLQQSSVYGPDCTITVSNGATIKAQQNYCAAEAGNVTASVVQGAAVITKIQTGSWASSIPGQVWVTVGK